MKALKFYKELKESEPSTSSRKSEVASADEEAARKYPEKLAKIIKDGEYCAHQVFNADETGLFLEKNANPYLHCKGGEGFDDFGEHDIEEELLVDEALNDNDIFGKYGRYYYKFGNSRKEPEDVTPLDEKLLREGFQLSVNWQIFFIQNDNDVERALKFQRDLKFCMSGYRELYKKN
ncbi:uncharacterized protein TNCV_4581541 [Trichonephila clavipes]|nr:uncharacterized protein TNCV_4581541 [Trichonephila clavipes]